MIRMSFVIIAGNEGWGEMQQTIVLILGLVVQLPSASIHRGERSDSCWSGTDSRLHNEETVKEREDEGVDGSKPISSSSSIGDGTLETKRTEVVRDREVAGVLYRSPTQKEHVL